MSEVSAAPAPEAARPAADLPRANILLVDDRPANLLSLEAILAPLGQRLVKATSGEEALKAVLDTDFAVILLDVQMPGMDGIETADLIKRRNLSRHTPIIFLTASNRDEAHIFKGYAHGAVDYLLKPFEPDILRSKVSVFVDLYQMAAQVKRQAARLVEREREAQEQDRRLEAERRARAEAEAATRAREEVLAAVSHDLRTPLSSIHVAASLLDKGLRGGQPTEWLLKQAERIHRSSESMRRLIDDLLDLSRMEAGRLALQVKPVAVRVLVEQAVELFRPLAAQKHQELREDLMGAEVRVTCDQDRIAQVFSNLLGNALKFTPAGGTVTLRSRAEGRSVHFTVADTGPGIAAEELPRLFERHWQAREGDRRGIGLGLSIAKGLVEAHGGRLWAESTPGSGSTFTFSLLVARE